jgi:3',5'-cyclic AMP phosphodiesterase CpdA
MAGFSILQISDTHLSPRTEHFRENNRLLALPLAQSEHDFIIHTGDVTLDGIRYDEDYALCRDFFRQSGKTIHFLAGNHDVGDNPKLSKPESDNGSAINAARYAKFATYFGADRWVIDQDNWRIIGISSMLIGSGLTQEAEQYDWIDAQLSTLGDRYLALFSHQPIYIDDTDNAELTYWTVDPQGWDRLEPLINHPRLRLIASGHLHQQRSARRGDVHLEWCSSIAFTTTEELVPEMGGTREVGYMEHHLSDDGGVESRVLKQEGFSNDHLEDVIKVVYPLIGS